MKIIPLLLLLSVCVLQSSAGSHTLQCKFTETDSKLTGEGLLDGELFIYCDSKCSSATPQTDWMRKIRTDDLIFWKEKLERDLDRFKESLKPANQNQTKGVQWIYGCELNDGTERRFWNYSSGGKDSITMELENGVWTSKPSQRDPTLREGENGGNEFQMFFLENLCIDWLKEFVNSSSTLERKGSRNRRAADTECHPPQGPGEEKGPHNGDKAQENAGPSHALWIFGVIGAVLSVIIGVAVGVISKKKPFDFRRVPDNPRTSSGDDSGA